MDLGRIWIGFIVEPYLDSFREIQRNFKLATETRDEERRCDTDLNTRGR